MRIRGRLTLSYLACGILPMLAVTAMCLVNSRNSGLEIRDKASEDLRQKMTERCTAVRNTSSAEIVDYFQTIRDHVITMSEDISVVDAMRDFTASAEGLAEERELDDEAIAAMRHDLVNYYENSFAAEYRNQNDGKNPSATSKLNMVAPSGVILQHQYIKNNSNPLGSKHILDASEEGTSYDKLHAKYHPFMRSFLERGGYYDIFLIDAKTGTVVYSVFKELDFGTNLKSGPYANSNFARVFNETLGKPAGEACLVDFECYYPSYEAPASFIGSPIYEGNQQIGSIVFQMPISRVNSLIARDAGLGKTGESMLVGGDMKQRCDSKRDPEACSLIDAFRMNKTDLMRTDSVRKALSGETGVQTTTNYLGEEVISAFAPITVLGLNWAVTTEVTTAEAFASVADMEVLTSKVQSRMLWMSALALVVVAGLVVAVSYVIVRSIVHPIDATVETLRDIAEGEGDLTRRLDENQVGELGDLAKYFNQFVVRIHDIIGSISGNAGTLTVSSRQLSESATHLSAGATQSKAQSATVSSAAEELSINMQNMARSTEEMSGGINSVATAVDEMRQTISEIAENAERSAEVAGQAAIAAEVSNDKVGGMGVAAEEIGKVIEVIQDIAEQTNLLALNATIEAARAGEAGKGFAVVATEVKQLAKQTATATDEIRTRIEAMQKSTGEAVTSIKEISDVIRRVNELSRVIASAVEEQNITTQQIAGHVSSTANLAQTVARGVAESAEASREITVNISQVDSVLLETASGADQSRASGDELLRLASEMQQLVSQFRLSRESVGV